MMLYDTKKKTRGGAARCDFALQSNPCAGQLDTGSAQYSNARRLAQASELVCPSVGQPVSS